MPRIRVIARPLGIAASADRGLRGRHRLRRIRAAAGDAARMRKLRQDQRFHIRACRGGRLKV